MRLTKVMKQSKRPDHVIREYEIEMRDPPGSMDQWKRQMKVWMTSLLLATASRPHQTELQITKKELEDFYDWIWESKRYQK